MANFPIKLDLDARIDNYGNKYYIAKLDTPISIHCNDGVAFMVFLSEAGSEQLHICPSDSKHKRQEHQPQVYKFSRESTSMPEVIEDLDKVDRNGRK